MFKNPAATFVLVLVLVLENSYKTEDEDENEDEDDAVADSNVRAPNAPTTNEELDEQSKDPSIIGGINVSGSSR